MSTTATVAKNPPESRIQRSRREKPLRIGFVPLLDAAPLAVASELGFFHQQGVRVRLLRQPGWASVRDRIIFGELDAAQAPAGLLFAVNSGLGPAEGRCLTAFVLNLQGNAVTLSTRLASRGVRDRSDLVTEARSRLRQQPLTFGVVSRYSTHMHLLRQWLIEGGLQPDRDVRLVVLPPQQMVASLESGHLDGFCAGEPWNTVAARSKVGWTVASSAKMAPEHPEKILIVREDFAENRSDEHEAMIRALADAAAWCDEPANRPKLARLLAQPQWLDLPEDLLLPNLTARDFIIFHRDRANEPTTARAAWVLGEMRRHKILPAASAGDRSLLNSFRPDLYDRALLNHTTHAATAQ